MSEPFSLFAQWYAQAQASEPSDANALALATVELTAEGPRPDVRVVLMKGFDERGIAFFTNYESAKGRQLAETPHAMVDFHWKSVRRQVRMAGPVERTTSGESDAYFATRPRNSQLSAWASEQSRPLDRRETFEQRLAEMDRRFPGDVPRPPFWGGFRLVPNRIEFWEEVAGRQHHRLRFDRNGDGWNQMLVYP